LIKLAKAIFICTAAKIYFNEQASDRRHALRGSFRRWHTRCAGVFLSRLVSSRRLCGWLEVSGLFGGHNERPLSAEDYGCAIGSLQNVDGIECGDVAWAPDGKIICSKNADVFLFDPDGSNQAETFFRCGPRLPHAVLSGWHTLAFLCRRQGYRPKAQFGKRKPAAPGVHEILTEMTDFPERCCGEWSPDGRYYFFETQRNGQDRIWALPERHPWWTKTPAPVPLTTVPPNFYVGPPSEDGKKLFVTARGAAP